MEVNRIKIMKLKNQVLSIEQVQELQELGFDVEKYASMCWTKLFDRDNFYRILNKEYAEYIRTFRNYGSEKHYHNKMVGANSRLDELQAGLLRVKLQHLDAFNEERVRITDRYNNEICNSYIRPLTTRPGSTNTWHQYVIHCPYRDELMEYLASYEIGTIIHYPIPPHLSEAYEYLGYGKGSFPVTEKNAQEILSLPIYNGMTDEEQTFVIDKLNAFQPKEIL